MWWAPLKSVHLYLSRGKALIRLENTTTLQVECDPTCGVAEMLERLDPHVPSGSRLYIAASASLIPLVSISYPSGLRGWPEHFAFARSATAQILGVGEADLVLEIDPACPELAAPLRRCDWDAARDWARAGGRSLLSLQPLWSQAPSCVGAGEASALAVREEDALTVMALKQGLPPRGMTLPLRGSDSMEMLIGRIHSALSLDAAHTLMLRFASVGPQERPPVQQRRNGVWGEYWSIS